MSVFICKSCGEAKEGKCKPEKCPKCGDKNMIKKEESCGCSCKCK